MKSIKVFTPVQSKFTDRYLAVREKEGFLISDEVLRSLPNPPKGTPQYEQWKLRGINSKRFCRYVEDNNSFHHILELGCGNGWFAHEIAKVSSAKVLGLDINLPELEQANRVFSLENLEFGIGDIFNATFAQKFDLIVLNAAVQYFPKFDQLIERLESLMSNTGEIHLLDTHFYANSQESNKAKSRTEKYYEDLSEAEMSPHYFHHTMNDIRDFELIEGPPRVLPNFWKKKSPFDWYRLRLT